MLLSRASEEQSMGPEQDSMSGLQEFWESNKKTLLGLIAAAGGLIFLIIASCVALYLYRRRQGMLPDDDRSSYYEDKDRDGGERENVPVYENRGAYTEYQQGLKEKDRQDRTFMGTLKRATSRN